MTPNQPTDRPNRTRAWAAVTALLRLGIVGAIALFLVLAVLLAMRRLAGALQMPLDTPALLALGALTAAAAGGLRGAWQGQRVRAATWADGFVRYGPSMAVLITAGSVSLSGSPPLGLAGCWALALSQELWTWRSAWGVAGRSPARVEPPGRCPPLAAMPPPRTALPPDDVDAGAQDVYQRWTRVRNAAGQDLLYGSLRADLAADQRAAALHVAFCPPFACTPQVAVEQTAGPDAQIKLAQVLPYGARLDVRLVRAAQQPSSIVLEIAVREAENH